MRLPLVIGEKPGLEDEIAHVNIGSADLPPAVAHHPAFVHNLRRHRFAIRAGKSKLAQSHRLGSSDRNLRFQQGRLGSALSDLIVAHLGGAGESGGDLGAAIPHCREEEALLEFGGF